MVEPVRIALGTVTSSLLTKVHATHEVCIRELVIYAKTCEKQLDALFFTKASSLDSIIIGLLWFFSPDCKDEMKPCEHKIIKFFVSILRDYYDHDKNSAMKFVNNTVIWFNRGPLILLWDFDNAHKKEMDNHLDVTDPHMHNILRCAMKNLQLEALFLENVPWISV